MKIADLFKGKKVRVMTDAKVEVVLEIGKFEEVHNSRDLEPSTRENDWWPKSEAWTTYNITFTNGYVKIYRNLNDIKLEE